MKIGSPSGNSVISRSGKICRIPRSNPPHSCVPKKLSHTRKPPRRRYRGASQPVSPSSSSSSACRRANMGRERCRRHRPGSPAAPPTEHRSASGGGWLRRKSGRHAGNRPSSSCRRSASSRRLDRHAPTKDTSACPAPVPPYFDNRAEARRRCRDLPSQDTRETAVARIAQPGSPAAPRPPGQTSGGACSKPSISEHLPAPDLCHCKELLRSVTGYAPRRAFPLS